MHAQCLYNMFSSDTGTQWWRNVAKSGGAKRLTGRYFCYKNVKSYGASLNQMGLGNTPLFPLPMLVLKALLSTTDEVNIAQRNLSLSMLVLNSRD